MAEVYDLKSQISPDPYTSPQPAVVLSTPVLARSRCNSYGARAWHRWRGQCPNVLPMAWMKQRSRQASA